MRNPTYLKAAVSLLPFFSLLSPGSARAETAPPSGKDAPQGAPAVSADQAAEIVVTARKRSEPLQKTPISADVVSGDTIATQGITNVQDLTRTIPAVQLAQGTVSNRQIIRGIGSGDNPAFEQSVGTFIDDIYHGRSRTTEVGLFDISRVEVLKGPQTTYFGNNAIAGALNIVTRDPGNVLGGNVRALYTPVFNAYQLEGGIDLPVDETLAVRVSGQATGGDGWIYDVATGDHLPHTRNYAVRGTLLWKPTANFTARLKAQHSLSNATGGIPVTRVGCPPPALFGPTIGFCAATIAAGAAPYSGYFVRNTSAGQHSRMAIDDYVGTLSLDTGPFSVTSVTGFSRYNYKMDSELDQSPLQLISLSNPERYHQFSQELRITSNTSGKLEYVAGLYYQSNKLEPSQTITYGFLNAAVTGNPALASLVPYLPLAVRTDYAENAKTQSMFGALTWKPIAGLQITGALRYSVVDKDFDRTIYVVTGNFNYAPSVALPANILPVATAFITGAGVAVPSTMHLSRSDAHLSRSASIQYEPSDRIMLYARYDNGFKAGGFNGIDQTNPAALLAFAPETVDSFEAGAKTRLPGNLGTFNVALFHSKFSNLQLSGVAPSLSGAFINRVQNAGGAISQGIEVDASLRLANHLRMSLSGAYLDAHYTSYPNATPTALQTLQGLKFQDLSGARAPLAPKWSANWTLDYGLPLTSDLTLKVTNTLFYKSAIFLNPNNDPYTQQAAYAREDLTIALASLHGWEISVIGKNLTDHIIRTYGASYPTSPGTYVFMVEPPRNISVQLKYAF